MIDVRKDSSLHGVCHATVYVSMLPIFMFSEKPIDFNENVDSWAMDLLLNNTIKCYCNVAACNKHPL